MHYRDDLDLQNLMDYIQKEVLSLAISTEPEWLLLSVEVFKLITDSLLDASETKARNRSLFCLFFCLSEGFHRRLHATYSSCSLWVTSCETALPSAHAGTFMSLGFPTGEALTGRMPSTDQHYVSKYTPDFTFHFSLFIFLFPPSSSVVDGTTTLIGLGTSTLIVHMTTPALSAVVCLIPAVLLFLGRSVFLCLAS